MEIKVAEYISEFFVKNGVTDCFMVTGGGAMHLDDAIGHQEGMRCIFNHHEQACAIAAEGYTRMTGKLALPSLIALCSIALGKPVLSSTAILGEISISGTIIKVDELANALQVCLDSGAKRVLLPMTAAAELGTVPADLIGCFNLIFYSSAEDAVFKALGVE